MSNRGQLSRECGTYERRSGWLLLKDSSFLVKSEVKLTRSSYEDCVICHPWLQNQDLKPAINWVTLTAVMQMFIFFFFFSYQGSLRHFQVYQRNTWCGTRQRVRCPFLGEIKRALREGRGQRFHIKLINQLILPTNWKLFKKYWGKPPKKLNSCTHQDCIQ